MTQKTLYTTFDMNTDEGKKANWKLINASHAAPMRDAEGLTLGVSALTIFEREDADTGEPVKVIIICDAQGKTFVTSSRSFISNLVSYFEAGFPVDSVKAIKVSSQVSKAGRKYLTAEF